MKAAVIQFPGTNREQDMIAALRLAIGRAPDIVWHQETALSGNPRCSISDISLYLGKHLLNRSARSKLNDDKINHHNP